MKTLTAYYSRTGKNEKAAKEFQKITGSDIERIIDKKDRQGIPGLLTTGMDALRKKKADIQEPAKDPGQYDLVVMAYPLWGGIMAPAARAYIEKNKGAFKNVALLSISGGGAGNNKAVPDYEEATGKTAKAVLLLTEKESNQENFRDRIKGFAQKLEQVQV
jgi:flavodoxin